MQKLAQRISARGPGDVTPLAPPSSQPWERKLTQHLVIFHSAWTVLLGLALIVFVALTVVYRDTDIVIPLFVGLSMHVTDAPAIVISVERPMYSLSGGALICVTLFLALCGQLILALAADGHGRLLTNQNARGLTSWLATWVPFVPEISRGMHQRELHQAAWVLGLVSVLGCATFGLARDVALVAAGLVPFAGAKLMADCLVCSEGPQASKWSLGAYFDLVIGSAACLSPWCVYIQMIDSFGSKAGLPAHFWIILIVGFCLTAVFVVTTWVLFFIRTVSPSYQNAIPVFVFSSVSSLLILLVATAFFPGTIVAHVSNQIEALRIMLGLA